ncbi:Glycosyltransferase involved in cell wall bisynthesis [Pseudobutyrivibrio sp. ACV-2]|uniref:glycosyltransferase family 4 protein n=1 Tax=Pseudobutyrivibrio sp. ACV-2 TaxID=1520801 RepID=UPI00089DA65C|nr:glycosyltransferase family 4 protein [Pseudobutyrivibrio sp. ACV-2]SEA97021.1 Glycosyltransferase involved in cell wall bisynthesis [Pseudobutyrivibrio sp. ACV-2]
MKLKKKVLFVTAKWPYITSSTDGGDSTTKEIIRSLKRDYVLDMLCFRNDIDEHAEIEGVKHLYFYFDDFAQFKNYQLHSEDKFLIRIAQSKIAKREIKKVYQNYDFIVVQHAMFILDMEEEKNLLDKIVLYPMFTGSSYLKSGDKVPDIYIDCEKNVLRLVRLIVSPSNVEKNMLLHDYGVDEEKIIVAPRSVDFTYQVRKAKQKTRIRLLYIASVRTQKNHLDAMKLIKIIISKGVDAELHCVGAIQDNVIFLECIDFLRENDLVDHVVFHGNKSHEQIEEIMQNCDINISVSKWETFGRGVYEGMAFGLPTVVIDKLKCVTQAENIGIYPIVVSSIAEMGDAIIELFFNIEKYEEESKKGEILSSLLSVTKLDRFIRKQYYEVFGTWDATK